jgi:hypothetical protein
MRIVVAWMFAFGLMSAPAALAVNLADNEKAVSAGASDVTTDAKASPTPTPTNAEIAAEVDQLRALLKEQSAQIAALRADLASRDAAPAPSAMAAPGGSSVVAPNSPASPILAPKPGNQDPEKKESPLSFRIGGADFTPGGFMDFTSIFRSTNTGNPGGTNFFAIPFNNQVGGHLTEERFSAQNSRVSLKVHDKFGENDVTGYYEMDFLGNDAANVFVTSNSHTFRQRLYFVDYKRDRWEVLAGQAWSWLTPNRVGLSPYPSDVFYSLNMDFNYQVGLTWTRAPQVRFAFHPNEHWALGVALENPEQFGGQGEVLFPQFFNAQLGGQIDEGNISSTPNLHPDIIPKVTWDTTTGGGKHMHAEIAGLVTSVKITDIPSNVPDATFVSHSKTGGGVEAAVNLEFLKNIRFVANGFWSDGGGRYIFGMGPQAVFFPVDFQNNTCGVINQGTPTAKAVGCDVAISLVHSGSGIAGFEAQITPKTMIYGYYGGAYFQRNFATDLTFASTTNPTIVQPFTGFGWPQQVQGGVVVSPGSPNNHNRSVQEPTLGWIQTFWKSPQYGALQLITQASYLTRSPWFVAAGAPKNAHLAMGWVDLRYVLP